MTTPKIDLIALDARLRTMESDTGENFNRLAQSVIDLQNQIEALQGSDRMNKEHIKRMQDANTFLSELVDIAGKMIQQAVSRIDALEQKPTTKPTLWDRLQKQLKSRFGV